jgi:hypothetical protein
MEMLFLICLLQIKHWYVDFKIQTYMQTVKKGEWLNPIGLSHSIEHFLATTVALLIFSIFYPINPLILILVSAIEGIIHYLIDFTKVKYGCKDITKPLFWNQFGLDQLAHQLTYIIIAWFLLVF